MYVLVYFKIVTFQSKELQKLKESQIRLTSPSTHLRQVGYYRKFGLQSEAFKKGFNVMEVISN